MAQGNAVKADIGGNLDIESLQDTSVYKSKNQSIGGSVTVGAGFSASLNVGQQKIDSDFASVTEQSGIKAGDGGFQVTVQGDTDLKGAVIASSDNAMLEGRNRLTTATIAISDIQNRAEYSAQSVSLGGGYSMPGSGGNILKPLGDGGTGASTPANSGVGTNQQGQATTPGVPGSTLPSLNGFSATPPIALSASGSGQSTTRSAVGQGSLVITDDARQQELTGKDAAATVASLNRDTANAANVLKPIFDEQEIKAGFAIVGALARETGTFLNSRAKEADAKNAQADKVEQHARDANSGLSDEQRQSLLEQAVALRSDARSIAENWGAGGTYRQITTALVAAASGNVTAANSEFARNMVVNHVQQQGAGYIGRLVAEGTLTEGSPLHAALHGIVACAGAAAGTGSCASGAAGAAASSLLTGLFDQTSPRETHGEREAKRNLIASLVTGIAAAGTGDAATASGAAVVAIDDNWLATQQVAQAARELKACRENPLCQLQTVGKWAYVSAKQDALTAAGVVKGLAQAGWSTAEGLAGFIADPIKGLDGLRQLIANDGARQQLGDKAFAELDRKIGNMRLALVVGGDQNAELLGRELGSLIWEVGSVVTLAGTAARAGVALANVGVTVGARALEKAAFSLARVEAEAAKGTGTVWDSIKATQGVWSGTSIPRSFELTAGNSRVWVHGNATEHLAEYATSMPNRGVSMDLVRVGTQQQLRSLQAAVEAATANGMTYNRLMTVGGWELKFAAPRAEGQLPALIHALPVP